MCGISGTRDVTFSFLRFDYRRVLTRRGVWGARITPRMKARTVLLRKLKDVFRRHQPTPGERIICLINPIHRGWVNYFRVGHSSRCFGYVKDWLAKKIRRYLMLARKRRGFGWNRWSRAWLYQIWDCLTIMEFDIIGTESAVGSIGLINFQKKLTQSKRSAGNPHAAFDEARTGNRPRRHRASFQPY